MSTFRTRVFHPVPPAERPRRSRRGVRLVVTDGTSVLLLADSDPGIPGSRWYVTPGGGIDEGESPADAALRELAEETGLRIAASELVGPVMERTAVHGYSDQILSQHELFYVVRHAVFEPDPSGYTEAEKITLTGHVWLPLDAVATSDVPVWPAELAEVVALAETPERWPWRMGVVEESTVPIDAS